MARKDIELIGSPGVVRDSPAHKIIDSAFSDAQNVRFGEKGAEALMGDMSIFSAASITPLWINVFPPLNNPHWVYGDLTKMFVFEGSTHTEITRASGVYAGNVAERWQATMFNGVAIFNNTIDLPQSWTPLTPATKLIDLPNWVTTRRAKSIRSFKNFLVALNLTDSGTERPYRVLWSDSADSGTVPGSWDSINPATDSREFDLAETSDFLVDQLTMGDVNIIYKETSTWGMQFIGPPFFFRFWKILSTSGLLHRDCVVNVPMGHVVVTQDDIIVHGGQIDGQRSILSAKLRRWLFSSIDVNNFFNSFLLSSPLQDQVYFCFPEIGETNATQAVVWNWREQSCGVRDLTTTPFGAVGPIGSSLDDDIEWGV